MLRQWSGLGAVLRLQWTALSFSESFAPLLLHAQALRAAEVNELTEIVGESDKRLKPLGEPLAQRIGLNRWLAGAREEAYSDWLKWLFEEMNAGELVKVLSIHELSPSSEAQARERVHVARETVVEEGHEGQSGRIDLILELGSWAVVTIEVKKGDAGSADPNTLRGYRKSVEDQFCSKPKAFILLVSSSNEEGVEGFKVRRYDDICRNLRRLAISWLNHRLLASAIMLMVVAAIESNLLRFSVQENSYTPATLWHLKTFIERTDYE